MTDDMPEENKAEDSQDIPELLDIDAGDDAGAGEGEAESGSVKVGEKEEDVKGEKKEEAEGEKKEEAEGEKKEEAEGEKKEEAEGEKKEEAEGEKKEDAEGEKKEGAEGEEKKASPLAGITGKISSLFRKIPGLGGKKEKPAQDTKGEGAEETKAEAEGELKENGEGEVEKSAEAEGEVKEEAGEEKKEEPEAETAEKKEGETKEDAGEEKEEPSEEKEEPGVEKAEEPEADKAGKPGEEGEGEGGGPKGEDEAKEPAEGEKEEEGAYGSSEEEVMEILMTVDGVGLTLAKRVIDAGVDSKDKLKKLDEKTLLEVEDIGPAQAEAILDHIRETMKKPEKAGGLSGIGSAITGVFGKMVGTLKGFFKGKKPTGKAEEKEAGVGKEEGEAKGAGPDEKAPSTDAEEGEKEPGEVEAEAEAKGEGEGEGEEKPAEPGRPPSGGVTVSGSDETPSDDGLLPEGKAAPDEGEPLAQMGEGAEKAGTEEPVAEPEAPEGPKVGVEGQPSGAVAEFIRLEAVDTETATRLAKAGYRNVEELREAVVDDLVLVPGINMVRAEEIVAALARAGA